MSRPPRAGELEARQERLVGRIGDCDRDAVVGVEAQRDRPQPLGPVPWEQPDRAAVDRRHADVDELDLRLRREHAGDVVLEADAQPHQRLAEQLALFLLLERPVELVA
jgi:hypothetical protein